MNGVRIKASKINQFMVVTVCLILLIVSACGKNDDETVETVKYHDADTFSFKDGKKGTVEVQINQKVPAHDYDWNCLTNDGQNISYDDSKYQIRKGIDVAKYQGTIDWKAVKEDGYEFAIIRVGYRGYGESGKLCLDSQYEANIKGAEEAGLDVGVYIFSQAINEDEAVEEAEFVIDALDGRKLQMPVVYDPETITKDKARTDDVTGEQFTNNTIAFCERIKAAGYQPMVYTNIKWEAYKFELEKLNDIPIWYADYENKPQTPYHFEMWQYSADGTVAGVNTICDLDIQFIEK